MHQDIRGNSTSRHSRSRREAGYLLRIANAGSGLAGVTAHIEGRGTQDPIISIAASGRMKSPHKPIAISGEQQVQGSRKSLSRWFKRFAVKVRSTLDGVGHEKSTNSPAELVHAAQTGLETAFGVAPRVCQPRHFYMNSWRWSHRVGRWTDSDRHLACNPDA